MDASFFRRVCTHHVTFVFHIQVEVITPEDHMGDVIGDLNSRRGVIDKLDDKPGGMKLVASFVPLAEMFQYVSQLRGMTKGRAQYSMKLERYEVVPPNIQTEIVSKVGLQQASRDMHLDSIGHLVHLLTSCFLSAAVQDCCTSIICGQWLMEQKLFAAVGIH